MQAYWDRMAEGWKPLLKFKGSNKEDWIKWEGEARAKLLELLGDFPEKVPLNAEVEYSVEEVDPNSIGMMGLSGGGTMTAFIPF